MTAAPSLWHRVDRLLARVRTHRRPVSLGVDGVVICLCWNFTYLFRLGFERWLSARPEYDAAVMVGVVAVYLCVFLAFDIPRGMWRFSGFGEVKRLTLACAIGGLLSAVVVLMLHLHAVPRAVLALHPVVALMGLCMVRMAYRMTYEHMRSRITGGDQEVRRAIVLGAGEAAQMLMAGLPQQGWTVLALLDDDPAKKGARIAGTQVVGPLVELSRRERTAGATHVIVAMPGATAAQRRRAIDLAAATGLPVWTVPSFSELRHGSARVERVRAIEPEDLLGRDPVALDEAGIAELVGGKTVLVTGAGGSIGSELCRQVAMYGPARLVLYELSEFALYQIEQQLGELHPHLPLVRLIGDVRDPVHLRSTFQAQRPHIVFHAAAFKHVPLMEDDNAWAALRNNTLGTYNAATAAAASGAERFVLISTDKAVNPTNVMGATKRAAEMVLSTLALQGRERNAGEQAQQPDATLHAVASRKTIFCAVRFGNVLGSSGSVIPKFKEQIARGGPVTVTHSEITRYFMTIPEAVRLVLQAATLARTNEQSGQVYVLDMGEPIRIVQLARDMIRLSGHREDEIGIVFSGLRPGEKLYEELLADADHTLPSEHPRLRIARLANDASSEWMERLLAWIAGPDAGQPVERQREALQRFVPEYSPPGHARTNVVADRDRGSSLDPGRDPGRDPSRAPSRDPSRDRDPHRDRNDVAGPADVAEGANLAGVDRIPTSGPPSTVAS